MTWGSIRFVLISCCIPSNTCIYIYMRTMYAPHHVMSRSEGSCCPRSDFDGNQEEQSKFVQGVAPPKDS